MNRLRTFVCRVIGHDLWFNYRWDRWYCRRCHAVNDLPGIHARQKELV